MNQFEKILLDAQAEREKRQARRREEEAQYRKELPKFTPQLEVKPPMEVRERIRERIRSLLTD
jgi:hypothetical protein